MYLENLLTQSMYEKHWIGHLCIVVKSVRTACQMVI